MKLNTSLSIIIVAFIISLCGFIVSVALPKSDVSDILMLAALLIAAASGIIASVFTKKFVKSKQWNYVVTGGILMLIGFLLQIMGSDFVNNILKVSGCVISIIALARYIYLNRSDFINSKWILFIPLILTGSLLKHMYLPCANIVIFSGLLLIVATAIVQLTMYKKYTVIQLLLLVWQIVICVCIFVFYFRHINFRHIKLDYIIIAYIFTWLALVDTLLQDEKKHAGE